MTDVAKPKQGTCFSMCPKKELWIREKEGLLHEFEIDESTKGRRKPKGDPTKAVKSFYRPAAGRLMTDLSELRPGPVLMMTIRYLFTKIATRTDCDWIVVYDFLFDRLRAIRQDIVIQRMDMLTSICILERIVRFHVYSAERLCERNIQTFDPKLNMQHLLECMSQLLYLYDNYESELIEEDLNISENTKEVLFIYDRSEMEALNIVLYLGDPKGLARGMSLPQRLRQGKDVQLALKVSFAWYLKNYVRTCRLIQTLQPILMYGALCNLRTIRRNALHIMSVAYNNKNLTFPGLKLQEWLLYKNFENVKKDCELFGLTLENENIRFQKSNFKESVQMANSEMFFTKHEMHSFLPEILLE